MKNVDPFNSIVSYEAKALIIDRWIVHRIPKHQILYTFRRGDKEIIIYDDRIRIKVEENAQISKTS